MNSLSACDVARFFLATNDTYTITNSKLQKLCAYAQGISLVYLGKPLFFEAIELWDIGPVIPGLYELYKKYDNQLIPQCSIDLSLFSMQERLVLAAVNDVYCNGYDKYKLNRKTMYDFPVVSRNAVIPMEELKKSFADNLIVCKLRRADALCDKTEGEVASPEELRRILAE